MTSRIAISGLTIVAALAIAIGVAVAQFSDTVTSVDNRFSSGDLELAIKDNNEDFSDSVSSSMSSPGDMAPGDTFTGFFRLKNTGNVDIDQILLKTEKTAGDSVLADWIFVDSISLESLSPVIAAVDFTALFNARFDTNSSGEATLSEIFADNLGDDDVDDDLIDGDEPGNPFGTLAPNEVIELKVTWKFDPTAPSSVENKSVTVKMTVTGYQFEGTP